MCYRPMTFTFSQARTVKCFFGSYQEKILFCGNMATQSQYFTTSQRKFLSGKNKAWFIVLYYTFIYGIVVVPPPALGPHCDLREGCQTLQWRGLSYVLKARVSIQGTSLPLLHTLLPPHRQPSTAGSLSSSSRGRMCHSSTPQAFHLHPLLPCGPPSSKRLPPTLRWLLSAAGKQRA